MIPGAGVMEYWSNGVLEFDCSMQCKFQHGLFEIYSYGVQSLTNPFFQYSNTPSLQSIICDVLTFLSIIVIINHAIP
jgi:hypothetical protein